MRETFRKIGWQVVDALQEKNLQEAEATMKMLVPRQQDEIDLLYHLQGWATELKDHMGSEVRPQRSRQ